MGYKKTDALMRHLRVLAPGRNSHSESARNDQFQLNRKSQCTRPPFKLFL